MIKKAWYGALVLTSACLIIQKNCSCGGVIVDASKAAAKSLLNQALGNPLEYIAKHRIGAIAELKKYPDVLGSLLKEQPEGTKITLTDEKTDAFVNKLKEQQSTSKQLQPSTAKPQPPSSSQATALATVNKAIQALPATGGPVFLNLNLNMNNQSLENKVNVNSSNSDAPKRLAPQSLLTRLKCAMIELYKNLGEWIKKHKILFAGMGMAGFYASLQAYIWHLSHSLEQPTCWSQWKKQCALEELYQLKQSDIAQQIIQSIEGSYAVHRNGLDAMGHIIKFAHETDRELSRLKTYQTIISTLERWWINKLFFYNRRLMEEAPQRIQRLAYVKNTVFAWLNDFKEVHSYPALFKQH